MGSGYSSERIEKERKENITEHTISIADVEAKENILKLLNVRNQILYRGTT